MLRRDLGSIHCCCDSWNDSHEIYVVWMANNVRHYAIKKHSKCVRVSEFHVATKSMTVENCRGYRVQIPFVFMLRRCGLKVSWVLLLLFRFKFINISWQPRIPRKTLMRRGFEFSTSFRCFCCWFRGYVHLTQQSLLSSTSALLSSPHATFLKLFPVWLYENKPNSARILKDGRRRRRKYPKNLFAPSRICWLLL